MNRIVRARRLLRILTGSTHEGLSLVDHLGCHGEQHHGPAAHPLSGEPPVIPAPTAPALPPDPNPGSWNGYGYAPQEGWYSGPQPYPTSPDAASWQSKYEQQKRRSVILAISTAAAAVIAVVALVWGFAAQSGSAGATAGGAGAGGLGATGGDSSSAAAPQEAPAEAATDSSSAALQACPASPAPAVRAAWPPARRLGPVEPVQLRRLGQHLGSQAVPCDAPRV